MEGLKNWVIPLLLIVISVVQCTGSTKPRPKDTFFFLSLSLWKAGREKKKKKSKSTSFSFLLLSSVELLFFFFFFFETRIWTSIPQPPVRYYCGYVVRQSVRQTILLSHGRVAVLLVLVLAFGRRRMDLRYKLCLIVLNGSFFFS